MEQIQPPPPERLTQYEALKQAGWIQTPDWILLWLLSVDLVVGIISWIIGKATIWSIGTVCFLFLGIVGLWTVMLAFRATYFILQLMADFKTLPQDAAKIAVSYQRGS